MRESSSSQPPSRTQTPPAAAASSDKPEGSPAPQKYKTKEETGSSSGHFRPRSSNNSRTKEPFPPFATHGLEPTDDVPTDAASFAVSQPAVPVPLFDPPGSFFAAFLLAAQLGDEFPCGPQSSRGGCS
ncbi:hypothetical protein CNMCM7927_006154 [Aspergillus lentulus]|nr:hypothetical protein CNMCM7927_006154 [Aspergillus lentulus]